QDGIAPRTERIHIEMSNGRVDIQRGDMWWWSGPTNQVVPALHAILPRLALEGSTTFPAIHAAAVLGPRGVILFPGASGRGKSTLSAALMAHGYEVLCDDTVV